MCIPNEALNLPFFCKFKAEWYTLDTQTKSMKKVLIFFFFAFFFLVPSSVSASNFTTAANTTYTIREDGMTQVLMQISLTNTSKEYYASSYTINVGFEDITRVSAFDTGGPITPVVEKKEGSNAITTNFNEKVTGEGKTLRFTVSFETPEVVERQNAIWEVDIPGIKNQDDFTTFSAKVVVPSFLGNPTYMKPVHAAGGLTFTKEQLGSSGISIAFGEKQYYLLSLNYHLENKNLFPVKTEIALPPSTNYQEIRIDSIEPRPINVTLDEDGNWLAEYHLYPSQKKDVTVKGAALVLLYPTKSPESEEDLAFFLRPQKYWDSENSQIKKLATELKTPSAIYNYVVKTLSYDFDRVTKQQPRRGAIAVLNDPVSAVCLEFTDLFIAIARAAGIPAREVNGFAYTRNERQRPLSLVKDVLHAWPEYYDRGKKQWISIDPTWGNTTGGLDYFQTLDFDHIAFVKKGRSSTYPIPAGGYKLRGKENVQDVFVSFAPNFPDVLPDVQIEPLFPTNVIAGFPTHGEILVKNNGTTMYPSMELLVDSSIFTPEQTITTGQLPPGGSSRFKLSFDKTDFLTNSLATITITAGESTVTDEIKVSPLFLNIPFVIVGGAIVVIFAITIIVITTRTRRVPIPR